MTQSRKNEEIIVEIDKIYHKKNIGLRTIPLFIDIFHISP